MQFLPIQEFARSPQVALSSLSKNGKTVLTKNGKPSAFLIKADMKNFEEIYELLKDIEFDKTVEDIRLMSKKNGNSKMSLKQINNLIADARKTK